MEAQQISALVIEIPCNSTTKSQTDSLNVRVYYTWQGNQTTITGYAVVTQETWFSNFDEIGSTAKQFSVVLPSSPSSPTSGYFDVTGLPLSGCAAKSGYGVKVHVNNFDEWGARGVLTVTAPGGAGGLNVSSLYIW